MKKRLIVFVLLIAAACAPLLPQPTTSTQAPSVDQIVASTLQALTAAAPPATSTPSGTFFSFQNVSFTIPSGLALGASGEELPAVTEESGAPWDVAPAHIRFTFHGYDDLYAKFNVNEIYVFPAADYASVSNGAARSLPRLQAILAAPSAPVDAANLPTVPYFNAAQMFAAQVKVIEFQNGSGVRMLTQYGQAPGPVSNAGTFYHFEGLTSDGKYYIVAVLSSGAPFLVHSEDPNAPPPPGGVAFPGYNGMDFETYNGYFQAVTDAVNTSGPDVFEPSLNLLDQMIASMFIKP